MLILPSSQLPKEPARSLPQAQRAPGQLGDRQSGSVRERDRSGKECCVSLGDGIVQTGKDESEPAGTKAYHRSTSGGGNRPKISLSVA